MPRDDDLRLLKGSHGRWKVEQWCYYSSGDRMHWGRPYSFATEHGARRHLRKEQKRVDRNRVNAEATWEVVE